ncbi:MAG: 3-hydroxyacyl-[acyl-carrier-protein] dehydratase FabZ, partial [Candidatus Competibacteraceae bacterium]|nr:3-hydroxyacyl-[acyl-carrier-protein] dehydratase FabZ [Candidatus Competibacteraceae bacterium]
QRPIMPGVLIIEALAQATGILAFVSGEDKTDGEMFYLVGVDNARFKQPVEPGDQLLLDVQIRRIKRGIGMFTGVARVDDKIVASAELMCARRGINI